MRFAVTVMGYRQFKGLFFAAVMQNSVSVSVCLSLSLSLCFSLCLCLSLPAPVTSSTRMEALKRFLTTWALNQRHIFRKGAGWVAAGGGRGGGAGVGGKCFTET